MKFPVCPFVRSLLFAATRQLRRATFGISLAALGIGFAHAESNVVAVSPQGTFRIETERRRVGKETDFNSPETHWIVAIENPAQRVRLNEDYDALPHTFDISPDEQWIFAHVHYGSGMDGGKLFRRKSGLRFEKVMDEEAIWKFFEKQALAGEKRPANYDVEIVDFIAWSADSARVLLSLKAGRKLTGEGVVGYFGWQLYYNVRRGAFELTDYLRRSDRNAYIDESKDKFGREQPDAIPELFDPLPPEAQIRARYEAADRRLNKVYPSLMERTKSEKDRKILRDGQRLWLKGLDKRAEAFAAMGSKAERERRSLLFLADATEERAAGLEEQLEELVR